MGKFAPIGFALLAIVVAAMMSLGCAQDTGTEGEYSGALAKLEEGPPTEDPLLPLDDPVEPNLVTSEEPAPPAAPEPELQGTVEGVGTHFQVTDSAYLNVALTSSEPVRVRLESVPRVITMHVEAAEGASSTQITLSGLEPATVYYKYTDNFRNLEELTTDANGICAYTQDLADSHLVFIQPTTSTIFLTSDGWSEPVGTWEPTTLTGTLTQNVTETIQIEGDGITLDGAGFTVTQAGDPYAGGIGVYVSSAYTVTIRNVNFEEFPYGIYAWDASHLSISDVTVQGARYGLWIYFAENAAIKNANVEAEYTGIHVERRSNVTIESVNVVGSTGIVVYNSDNATIRNANVQASSTGVSVIYSYGALITESTISAATSDGVRVTNYYDPTNGGHTISANTISDSRTGIEVHYSGNNVVSGNTVLNNADTGISIYGNSADTVSVNNTVSNNTVQGGQYGAITIQRSMGNSVTGNIVSNDVGLDAIRVCCNSDDTTLRSNESVNAPIVLDGLYGFLDYCIVDNNIVRGSTLSVQRAYDLTVTKNTLENSSMLLDFVSYSLVSDNTQWSTSWSEGHGIYFSGYSSNTELARNVTSDNPQAGIFLGGGIYGYVRLTDNVAERNGTHGIITGGSNNTLTGNRVVDNAEEGLWLAGSNTVVNTTATNNSVGIRIRGTSEVSGSIISSNTYGVLFDYGSSNTLRDNTITDNRYGIYFSSGSGFYNQVFRNNVRLNDYGMMLYGYGNDIYNNDFVDNRYSRQAYASHRHVNYLNKAPPIGGNYWSNWNSPDANGDGFVDNQYVLYRNTSTYGGESVDYYPLATCLFPPCSTDSEGPVTSDVTVNPSVVEVNGSVLLTAIVDDRDTGGSDIALVEYRLDESPWTSLGGPYPSSAVGVGLNLYAPTTAGVYEVCVRGTDTVGNVGEQECTFLVAYDPSGGFVTGGGWIDSEAGAYVPDPSLAGKANFGFVSKYKKGASVPTGNTEFQFKVADLNFKSSSYDWLVIAGDNARYKGIGTINGEGSYKFMLWGGDGNGTDGADTFRIRIWTEDEATAVETDLYDNGFGQDLGGGSVVIHKAK